MLFDKKGEVTEAYPLTTDETRPYRVVAGKRQLRALGAIDALAIGALFHVDEVDDDQPTNIA